MRRRRRDRVDHRLQRFLVHVHLLRMQQCCTIKLEISVSKVRGKGCIGQSVFAGIIPTTPTLLLVNRIDSSF